MCRGIGTNPKKNVYVRSVRRWSLCETLAICNLPKNSAGESNKSIIPPPAFIRIYLFLNLLAFFVRFENPVHIDNYGVCQIVHRLDNDCCTENPVCDCVGWVECIDSCVCLLKTKSMLYRIHSMWGRLINARSDTTIKVYFRIMNPYSGTLSAAHTHTTLFRT